MQTKHRRRGRQSWKDLKRETDEIGDVGVDGKEAIDVSPKDKQNGKCLNVGICQMVLEFSSLSISIFNIYEVYITYVKHAI